MKVTKRILSLLLVGAMLFALAACTDPQDGTTGVPGTTGNPVSSDRGNYTVKLTTAGGMALSGYQVLIYADEACTEPVDLGTTDSNGSVTFSLKKGGEYFIKLDANTLKGYDVQDHYKFDGYTADLTLTSSLIQGESLTSNVFKLGDIMYDFTFEDHTAIVCPACETVNDLAEVVNGQAINQSVCGSCGAALASADGELQYQQITLSEVLAEKELVILNFWYTTCSWCVKEFPVMQQAYDMIGDSVEIFALDAYPTDSVSMLQQFVLEQGLTFPVGKVDANQGASLFLDPATNQKIEANPTSIFIDRYGAICMIEPGAVISVTDWTSIMSHFIGEDYEQILIREPGDIVERIKPTWPNPSSEEIDGVFTGEDDVNVTYTWDEDEYSWPFLVGEKDGESCIYASNKLIYESYAIMYANVEMQKGDVLAFDYWTSTEKGCDILYVIVNDEPIYNLSGHGEGWSSAYCWIAEETGTYELALCYQKDSDTDEGDDTVYLKNLRTVAVEDIDTPSYLPRQAATENADGSYSYAEIVLNEQDGYYHVGTVDGPLLLAGLYDFTQFSETEYIYQWAEKNEIDEPDGPYGYNAIVEYFSAATNSNLPGWCTVNEKLASYLKEVARVKGYRGEENEWMLFCKYYDAYGTDGKQLEDPVAGLKKWSALTAVEGVGVETNHINYNGMPLIPRGKLARFTPTKSGVYRITSTTNYQDGLEAWLFDDEHTDPIYTYMNDQMLGGNYADANNVNIVYYMEAGKNYYIDIAPYDVYGECDVWYDIVYMGESYEVFRACAPGPFTSLDGSMSEGSLIIRGIKTVLNPEDGYYHEDLGRDANGNQIYGSIIYAYFTGSTEHFSEPIVDVPLYNEDGTPRLDAEGNPLYIKGLISKGGFDFTYGDNDELILSYLRKFDGDQDATWEYIQSLVTRPTDEEILDVFEGKFHGAKDANGNPVGDLTEEIKAYESKIIYDSEHPELNGCVPVDARLAELLQLLMDKYTFAGVEDSWQKMCFYYDQLG